MKIGLLDTCIGNFGQKGFYNTQEIGLGKALLQLAEKVYVYKLLPLSSEYQEEIQENENGHRLIIRMIPSRSLGSNGLLDVKKLDTTIDVLVYFSDTQLWVPQIQRWALRHRVQLIPYLGVIESHSTGKVRRMIVDLLFRRNLVVYKKHRCIAKTPKVAQGLKAMGVTEVTVAPVGLDFTLLRGAVRKEEQVQIRQERGFSQGDRLVLMVGRMEEDRNPLDCVPVFRTIYRKDPSYRLCLVGKGSLKEPLFDALREEGLLDAVYYFDRIPNDRMWEFYSVSELLISFSRTEIFGMSILEAMYYGTPVFAIHAPGPDYILENGISGFLSGGPEEMVEQILNGGDRSAICESAFDRVTTKFSWNTTAEIVMREIECEA